MYLSAGSRYRNRVEFKVASSPHILNVLSCRYRNRVEFKVTFNGVYKTRGEVDIETEWNLKVSGVLDLLDGGVSRYRNRVEFKVTLTVGVETRA